MIGELEFLSPDRAVGVRPTSPLERALRGSQLHDLSLIGKIEVRGDVEALDAGEVVRITPRRALVLCDYDDAARVRAELRQQFRSVIDMTGTLAGLQVEGEALLRRLTDLDLDALPAVGALAHVPALVLRDGHAFRLFFPAEYADYVAEVVLDAMEGLP